jgi:hypothetical protein
MSDFVNEKPDNGEELVDEEGRNQTQQAMDDEEGAAGDWDETNDEPAQGEGGQDIV